VFGEIMFIYIVIFGGSVLQLYPTRYAVRSAFWETTTLLVLSSVDLVILTYTSWKCPGIPHCDYIDILSVYVDDNAGHVLIPRAVVDVAVYGQTHGRSPIIGVLMHRIIQSTSSPG